jgi:hypothetical protein
MALAPRRYTQQEIDDLIACPKVVSEAPRRDMKLDRGHFASEVRRGGRPPCSGLCPKNREPQVF